MRIKKLGCWKKKKRKRKSSFLVGWNSVQGVKWSFEFVWRELSMGYFWDVASYVIWINGISWFSVWVCVYYSHRYAGGWKQPVDGTRYPGWTDSERERESLEKFEEKKKGKKKSIRGKQKESETEIWLFELEVDLHVYLPLNERGKNWGWERERRRRRRNKNRPGYFVSRRQPFRIISYTGFTPLPFSFHPLLRPIRRRYLVVEEAPRNAMTYEKFDIKWKER